MVILKIMVFVVSPGNLLAHPVLLLNAVDRHGQGGGARASAESGDEGAACKKLFTSAGAGKTFSSFILPAHVEDECHRIGARDRQVDEGKNNEAVQEESNHDGEEVESQLGQLVPEVLRLEDLAGDQEADADRREVDDTGGELRDGDSRENCVQYKAPNLHHDHSEATEEP